MSWIGDFIWKRLPWSLRQAECTHFSEAVHIDAGEAEGCEECLKMGGEWVHLRRCMVCGKVGCCDNSPNIHATRHYEETGHSVSRSIEAGESWGWCFVDQVMTPDVEVLRK